ncbi:DUF3027 domain-containing protein [Pseudactinotalea terrae]|uniref:DUF3027 domain-containing protein n=1 Tax=Pseudactinotalea terrae TaxID=1743262 RepID=UPI0012E24585|nr:DUF3027 domain-containing protein [Pseudactinotalea terrae]
MSTTTETSTRRPAKDAVLAGAVDLAREVIESETDPGQVGEHLGFTLDGERFGTHAFACLMPGYSGWHWIVTVARAPRARTATVCETGLLPGDGALLAKVWLPWAERLAPGDLSPTDRLPFDGSDERLESGVVPTGDPEIDRVAIHELGLDRERVMTSAAIDAAAARWYDGVHGPASAGARAAGADCATCGFIIPLAGPLGTLFGVCANEWSPDDGKVVSFDHGCGAHSETDVSRSGHDWEQAEPLIDELDIEVIRTDPPSE